MHRNHITHVMYIGHMHCTFKHGKWKRKDGRPRTIRLGSIRAHRVMRKASMSCKPRRRDNTVSKHHFTRTYDIITIQIYMQKLDSRGGRGGTI